VDAGLPDEVRGFAGAAVAVRDRIEGCFGGDQFKLERGAEAVVIGDVSTVAAMRAVASQANALGRFDAVIHNVGLGYREPRRIETADSLSQLWAVNVLAPYVLTALMYRPDRLVYLSSGLHRSGDGDLGNLQWALRGWNGTQAYSDGKLPPGTGESGWDARVKRRRAENARQVSWIADSFQTPSAPRTKVQYSSVSVIPPCAMSLIAPVARSSITSRLS
jgi:hypothetical protein